MKILAIDIGAGTQDVLLFDSQKKVENCISFVLPTPSKSYAEKLKKIASHVFIHGDTIGGGALGRAILRHLQKGYRVVMEESAVTAAKIEHDLRLFIRGELDGEKVFKENGHGAVTLKPLPRVFPVIVTGPNRDLFRKTSFKFIYAAPGGNTMMTGPMGLVRAAQYRFAGSESVFQISKFKCKIRSKAQIPRLKTVSPTMVVILLGELVHHLVRTLAFDISLRRKGWKQSTILLSIRRF